MEYQGLIFAALLLVIVPNALALRSNTQHEQDIVKDTGDEVTLACDFLKEGYQMWLNPVVWFKTVRGERFQLNDNGVFKSPFHETGRFSLEFDVKADEAGLSLPLTIKNIGVADDGTYSCEMNGDNPMSPIEHTLVVPDALESLEIKTNTSYTTKLDNGSKKVYEFQAHQPSYLSCQSEGGNPKPELKFLLGDEDITHEFEQSVEEEVSGDKGLQTVRYKMSLTNTNFQPSDDQSGERLKCVAKFGRHTTLRETVSGMMDVKFSPKFDCARSHTLTMPIDVEDFIIFCVIRGNPPVPQEEVMWSFDTNATSTTTLTIGEIRDKYSAYAEETADGFLNVTLKIKGVGTSHFNTYNLKAANTISEETFEIILGEATTTTTTTTTKPVVVPVDTDAQPNTGSTGNGAGRLHGAGGHVTLFTTFAVVVCSLLAGKTR